MADPASPPPPVHPASEDRPPHAAVPLLPLALQHVLRLWRPMLGWTVLVGIGVGVLLGPLTSAVLGWQILRGRRMVIGNDELVAWILSLPGIAYVLLGGGLAITGATIRYAGLFRMLTDELDGRPASLRRTAFGLVPRLPTLYRLCVTAVAVAALLALPLIAGMGGVYLLFLGDHDINYYLFAQPSEWRWALGVGGAWGLIWILGAGLAVGRILPVVPAYLDGHTPLRVAARRAWARTRGGGQGWRLVRLLVVAGVSWGLVRVGVGFTTFRMGAVSLEWLAGATDSLTLLVLGTGAYLAITFLADGAVGFLGFSTLAAVLTLFYHLDTDLHARIVEEEARARGLRPGIRRVGRALHPRRAFRVLRWLHPRRLAAVAATLLVLSAGGSLLLLETLPEPRPVTITAHRAGPPPAPENTLSALEASIRAGADVSEIDVLRTRDGTVVVVHDADLMRVAGDPRRIAEVTFEEIASVIQAPDDGTPPGERRLVTLADFLERARDRIRVNIELKYYGWDPGLAPAALEVVREAGMEGQVVFMSLHLDGIRQIRATAPEIPVGYVSAVAVGEPTSLPVDFLAVSRPQATARLVRLAEDRGLEVHVWTVNDAAAIAEFIERGVDGIITDDPALAVAVRDELAGLSPAGRLLLRFRRIWDDPGAHASAPL